MAEANAKFRSVIDHAADAIVLVRPDSRLTYANREACKLLNYAPEEIPALTFPDIAEDGLTDFDELVAKDHVRTECVVKRKDGNRIHTELNAVKLPDGSLFGALRDITDQKANEAGLRFQAMLLDNVSDSVFVADKSLRLIYVNEKSWKSLGYTRDELMAINIVDLDSPEYAERIGQHIAEMKRTGGTTMPVEVSARIVSVEGRDVVVGTVRDITERKQAEEKLRGINERLNKVLEVETVGVMFWDLTSGCLTDANDTFLKLMGYSRHDVETRALTWQKLTPSEYFDLSRAEVEKFQIAGRIGPYEKEYFRKDGPRRWFIFAGSSLGNNECVEFCVNVTERKHDEQRIRESCIPARRCPARIVPCGTRCLKDVPDRANFSTSDATAPSISNRPR